MSSPAGLKNQVIEQKRFQCLLQRSFVIRIHVRRRVCLDLRLLRRGARHQCPINLAISSISRNQPLIGLLEMAAVKETSGRAEGAGMHALQHEMTLLVHLLHPLARRRPPSHEDDATRPFLRHQIDDPLREPLPAPVGVRVGFVSPDGEARVEHEDAAVGPSEGGAGVGGRTEKAMP
ncbi:hypothetical protein L249_1312 [Ophiocordyceps polyrhachis-furcata BCC 54312]|uniref:Uncharacterized protein n=1 Tax=Ophiocordyceps polyrhachis-furcata BCC 54312 TaxID=1330021 RepID=A0A367LD08_9HYPO|nr:hypothetical protein L249_1312 [Ophiocordyceps polyrhachis-furcata BCC 54312]